MIDLYWSDAIDMDLFVTDPSGNVTSYRSPDWPGVLTNLGGCVFSNDVCEVDSHHERITWSNDEATSYQVPTGEYQITVSRGNSDHPQQVSAVLSVRVDGEQIFEEFVTLEQDQLAINAPIVFTLPE